MMKIYVHYEPSGDEKYEFTTVLKVDQYEDVVKLRLDFKKHFETYFIDAKINIEKLVNDKNEKVTKFKPGMDVFVVGTHSIIDSSTNKVKEAPKKVDKKQLGQNLKINFGKIRELQAEAEKCFKAGKLKSAIGKYYEINEESVFDKAGCLRNIAHIYYFGRKYATSIKFLKESIEINQKEASSRELLCDCYMKLGKYVTAMEQLNVAMKLYKAENKKQKINDIKIKIGICIYKMGRRQEGFQKITSILREDMNNHVGLCAYANAILEINRDKQEALTVLVKCLAKDLTNREVEKKVAQILMDESDGIKFLHGIFQSGNLPKGKEYSNTVFWLSKVVKRAGGITRALKMVNLAFRQDSFNFQLFYSKLKLMGSTLKFGKCLNVIKEYFRQKFEIKLGSLVSLGDIYGIIKNAKIKKYKQYLYGDLMKEFKEGPKEMIRIDGNTVIVASKNDSEKEIAPLKTKFQESDYELFALCSFLLQVLYVNGLVSVIPKIYELFEPVICSKRFKPTKKEYERELENFKLIAQNTSQLVKEISLSPAKPIYIVGDSFALSSAWRNIIVNGEKRTLVPMILFNLKISNLEGDVNEFDKKQFFNTCSKIPFQSTVVFYIGGSAILWKDLEADVESLQNSSIDDAIESNVSVLLNTIDSVRGQHDFQVYIHPVICPSDLKSSLTWNKKVSTKLNTILKFKKMKYLSKIEDMIYEDTSKTKIKQKYILTKNSLHPLYVDEVLSNRF